MGSPSDHLPGPIADGQINDLLSSISLPQADSIKSVKVTADYHTIYRIQTPSNDTTRHTQLILRVSGNHLPTIKTQNEVSVMSWLAQNTTIPIPEIVAHDSTSNNSIGHEYTLFNDVPGDTLSNICTSLDEKQVLGILDQLIDILSQLHRVEWNSIGGLRTTEHGEIVVGRCIDETFWQTADIEKYWPPGETIDTLNIRGPFTSYVDLVTAQVQKYIYLMEINEDFSSIRKKLVPRLRAFVAVLPKYSSELNNVKLRLAHKDLHFANMLYDVKSGRLTAILDWEFAMVVPMTQWNPRRAFLWNGRAVDWSHKEKQRLLDIFSQRCRERGLFHLIDASYASPLQESMQEVANYLRAVTEVVPRGQRAEVVPGWVAEIESNIAQFGV